jgi:hypothetical protein
MTRPWLSTTTECLDTRAVPLGRVVGSIPWPRRLAFARIHRRARTLNGSNVCRVRRRLAAGYYDSQYLLNDLVEMIVKDLALSPG